MSGTATSETTRYPADHLHAFCVKLFLHHGVPEEDARLAADVLNTADLRGVDTHGVQRLKTYHDMLSAGRINPTPTIRVVRETPSTATINGDNGLGLVVGPKSNDIAMTKASAVGSGWVSVCNTNHYGLAGYYVLKALKRDMIGWAMCNSTKLVAPMYGAEAMLGTNPIAIAFPVKDSDPIVVDLATSAAAYGKVEMAARTGESIPEGWALDKHGNHTTDPHAMKDGGAMLPLGSFGHLGGHKGYCLATMVDFLCCVLSGANWGPFAPPFALQQAIPERSVGKGIGHFFGAMRIDGFIDVDEFKQQAAEWKRTFKAAKPQPGVDAVKVPGQPEHENELDRRANGVPLVPHLVEELRTLGKAIGEAFD